MAQSFNRRQMLAGAGAAAAWAVLGTGRRAGAAAAPKAVIHETKVISAQPQFYHGWPTVTRRKSGELLLAYSGGRDWHVCPFGRVELMRSHDEGKTWGWPCVVADTEIDDRGAGVMETAKGTILVNWFTSTDYEPFLTGQGKQDWKVPAASLPRWQAAHNRLTAQQRKELLGIYAIRSTNDGLTWSAPCAVDSPIVDSPHGPIQLADGRLLHVGQRYERYYSGPYRTGVCTSADDGLTWQWLTAIPVRPGDTPAWYFEPTVVEASPGHLVAQFRNDYNTVNKMETLQLESSDGGKTWTMPHSIGVWGLPSHLLKLKDGRLLMSYGFRGAPFGNKARVSEDHGRTWSEAITLSDDGISMDLGYPSSVQLADGSLLTVWYEAIKGNPNAVLRQAHWSLDK